MLLLDLGHEDIQICGSPISGLLWGGRWQTVKRHPWLQRTFLHRGMSISVAPISPTGPVSQSTSMCTRYRPIIAERSRAPLARAQVSQSITLPIGASLIRA